MVRPGCARALARVGGVFDLLYLRYGLLLFPGVCDGNKELDYNTVNAYVRGAFEKMGFTNSRKVQRSTKALPVLFSPLSAQIMHFWRYYAAWLKHSLFTPLDDIKHDGRWEVTEFSGVYAYHLKPATTMVAAAGFDARFPERYHVPRTEVAAPESLLALVRSNFWVWLCAASCASHTQPIHACR